MYRRYIKRWIDVLLALCGIIILSPLFLLISLWIKLDSKGPVFFFQKRVGIRKTYFQIWKFRTMKTDAPGDVPTHLLENATQNITRCGGFLRRNSLDELPQLINVLKGEMSIVGPRPALWNQFDLIELRDRENANDVLPGLTGLAQVRGRDRLENAQKAKYDGEYARNVSFRLDLECVLLTFSKVGGGKDIVEGAQTAGRQAGENK